MRKLMRQREHLSGFCIGSVYEHHRRVTVGKREAAKLFGIETTSVVVEHHAAAHNHDSRFICLPNKESKSVTPGWDLAALFEVESQSVSHDSGCGLDAATQAGRSNERGRRRSLRSGKVAIPLLSLLANVNHVEEVRARAQDGCVSDGAEIRYRNLFNRRLLKKQKANGRLRGLG